MTLANTWSIRPAWDSQVMVTKLKRPGRSGSWRAGTLLCFLAGLAWGLLSLLLSLSPHLDTCLN